MANGIIKSITENGLTLSISVEIGGAIYSVLVKKSEFDALPDNASKQAYVITLLTSSRRSVRQYENIYPALVGTTIVIPD
jgi:hypothetical protein